MGASRIGMHKRGIIATGTVVTAVACAADDGRGTASAASGIVTVSSASQDDSATGGDDGDDGTAADGGSAASDPTVDGTAADDDDEGTNFDLGVQPDSSMPVQEGCKKVDFLFVIDNSGSMGDNQADLASNFPNFIEGIQATLEEVDEYQVGVITSDAYQFNTAPCGQLGGLVIRTGGTDSSNMVCGPYAAGDNFMTEMDDLATTFACAAKVGSEGNGLEMPMNAMEVAVRKDLGGPGECNEGFIRDDALLVIVIITDEWDGPGDPEFFGSMGNAATWYNTVVTAKGGIPENIVVLSLVHFAGCPPSDGFLSGDIETFTNMFGANGFLGCIDSDYGDLFMQATMIIDGACENFMPPG
jgi:hypothetical protein